MSAPFTQEELVLIEVADQTASFRGEHHHHHHGHGHGNGHHQPEFKAPEKLTFNMALYALKKLHTIDPHKLTWKESRLLEPVAPGPVTFGVNAAFYISQGLYGLYLWRTRGFKGYASLAVLPLIGLFAGRQISLEVMSYLRDYQYSVGRQRLVNDFLERYGEGYLLSVLNPAFRL